MRIRYRPAALADLDDIFSYISSYDAVAASRVKTIIQRSIARLARFPFSGRSSEIIGIRELPVVRYPYIVFYTVDPAAREVHILRVWHTARDARERIDA